MTDYTNTHANSFNVLINLATAPNLAFAAMHNAMVRMKWYMLRVPQWREAVIAAMGGEAALARWEARAARSQAPIEGGDEDYLWEDTLFSEDRPSDEAPLDPQEKAKTKYKPFKTDVDGLFRLARIATYKPWFPKYEFAPKTRKARGATGQRVWRMTPIAVTPDELRGEPLECSQPYARQVRDGHQCRRSAAIDTQLITDVPRLAGGETRRPVKLLPPPRRYSRSHPL